MPAPPGADNKRGMTVVKQKTSTGERRGQLRQSYVVECSWGRDARLTDLSASGCYVDCHRVPVVGEQVEITLTLDGAPLVLRGRVVHARHNLGFAMRFEEMEDSALARIHTILLAQVAHPSDRARR